MSSPQTTVRPVLKGVVHAVIRPEFELDVNLADEHRIWQQLNTLLLEIFGVTGSTVDVQDLQQVTAYYLDPDVVPSVITSVWKQFKVAAANLPSVRSCALSMAAHTGTVFVEDSQDGSRRTLTNTGGTVDFARELGNAVQPDRIWISQSCLTGAHKHGSTAAFHRLAGTLTDFPTEGIYEWRLPVTDPVAKPQPRPSLVSVAIPTGWRDFRRGRKYALVCTGVALLIGLGYFATMRSWPLVTLIESKIRGVFNPSKSSAPRTPRQPKVVVSPSKPVKPNTKITREDERPDASELKPNSGRPGPAVPKPVIQKVKTTTPAEPDYRSVYEGKTTVIPPPGKNH